MAVGEYLILFAAILIGLAVADFSLSLHKLLRNGRSIRWHPIVPVMGFIVLCLILNLWWGLYDDYAKTTEMTFAAFLPQVFMMLALFLLASAAFPDEQLKEGSSLKEFYQGNQVHFWGLFAIYLALVMINRLVFGSEPDWTLRDYVMRGWGNALAMALSVFLMFTKRMIFHWLMAIYLLVVIVSFWFAAKLEPVAAV